MNSRPIIQKKRDLPSGVQKKSAGKNWASFFKRTIIIILLFSLAVHLILLISFGGVAVIMGKSPAMPFIAETESTEQMPEVPPPPMEEVVQEENPPDAMMPEEAPAAKESAQPLEMMTVPGGASWAAAIPKDTKTSLPGCVGGTGTGTGTGCGTVKGTGRAMKGAGKLFGVETKAAKLGVIIDASKSTIPFLEMIMQEVEANFNGAIVIFVNGCGMKDWEKVKEELARSGKTKENVVVPKVVTFNNPEVEKSPAINRGGMKKTAPKFYEMMRVRPNTFLVTGLVPSGPTKLAFDYLEQAKVGAVYWLADFKDGIELETSDAVAKSLKKQGIQLYLHPLNGDIGQAEDFKKKSSAQLITKKLTQP